MQQGRALVGLRQGICDGSYGVRLALIASLVIASFESLNGDLETATQQIYNSISLLRYWQKSSGRESGEMQNLTEAPAQIDSDILGAVERLELQVMTFLAMNATPNNILDSIDKNMPAIDLPERLLTPADILCYGTKIGIATMRHMRKCIPYQTSTKQIPFPESLFTEREVLLGLLKGWKKATTPSPESSTASTATHTRHLGTLQLGAYSRILEIITRTSNDRSELSFDSYTNFFQSVVESSRYILQKDQYLRCANKGRFQFSTGLVMCLFYVATRSRVRLVRREALELLRKWPATNGVWDSLQAAWVAEWIINIEEEGCDETGYIPKEWRVRLFTLKWKVEGKSIHIECVQGHDLGNVFKERAILIPKV